MTASRQSVPAIGRAWDVLRFGLGIFSSETMRNEPRAANELELGPDTRFGDDRTAAVTAAGNAAGRRRRAAPYVGGVRRSRPASLWPSMYCAGGHALTLAVAGGIDAPEVLGKKLTYA